MLRAHLKDALKTSMKKGDKLCVNTLRLILAALKDRDIAARSKGEGEHIGDEEILGMLQSMIRQRRESIESYEKGGRQELARQEAEEIAIIEQFMPAQLEAEEMVQAIDAVLEEVGAKTLKDMGPAMAALKEKYSGRMDFAKASAQVKERLG
jgi:uncharacterized protein YqeY